MKMYVTEILAQSPIDGDVKRYGGPDVPGISFSDAQGYCENNGLGYCKVIGELIADIPCKEGTYEPDFANKKDYDTTNNN